MLFLQCSGGLELLCDSVKIHKVNVEQQKGVEKVNFYCSSSSGQHRADFLSLLLLLAY